MWKSQSKRELLENCLSIAAILGICGIAFKFPSYFDQWVYFPSFPNICDSIFLVLSACWLGVKIWKRK